MTKKCVPNPKRNQAGYAEGDLVTVIADNGNAFTGIITSLEFAFSATCVLDPVLRIALTKPYISGKNVIPVGKIVSVDRKKITAASILEKDFLKRHHK